MPRNNSRDINSKDSLINYLRHPAGLLMWRPIAPLPHAAPGESPGTVHKAAFRNIGQGRTVP